jgi:hypothetical protein
MDGIAGFRGRVMAIGTASLLALTVFYVLILTALPAHSQQAACDSGIVRLPSNVNGQITICSAIAFQVPALARQLNDLAVAQGAQQRNIQELTKLIRNLNSVGRNLGVDRQAQMLKTLSSQLGANPGAEGSDPRAQIKALTDRLDELKDILLEKLSDNSTAERTKEAINGPVGDAIAQLDVARADSLLENIQAQLHGIGTEVGEVHAQTTEIAKTLEQQQAEETQRRAEAEKQRVQAEEEARREVEEKEKDPSQFALINPAAVPGTRVGSLSRPGRLMVQVISPRGLVTPLLKIVFRDGTNHATLVTPTDQRTIGNVGMWVQDVSDFGASLTVCFSAMDTRIGQRRQLTQTYTIQTYYRRIGLTPVGDPKFEQADGETCDGLR